MACEQTVRVWSDNKGVETFFRLLCKGVCKTGEAECKKSTRMEGTPSATYDVEYCACDGGKGKEDPKCHIVLRTQKDGDKKGQKSIACDGDCTDKEKEDCKTVPVGLPHELPIPVKGKYTGKLGSYQDYKCECKPKEPKKP